MPATRTPGMDHPHYDWSPLPLRPRLEWPEGKTLAITPVIAVERFEDPAPEGSVVPKDLGGGMGARPGPNFPMIAHREYGHRVGIFRLVEMFAKYQVPLTIAIDAMSAENYPFLVNYLKERGATFLAHGISVSRSITSRMSEEEERAYIRETLDRLKACGIEPRGWLGPEYSESERTPELVAAAGVDYLCDWLNDEQPYRMNYGDLVALPMWCDYDDSYALVKRQMTEDDYNRILTRGVDQLSKDGAQTARLMAFTIRPWLVGQPHRLGSVESFLAHARRTSGTWFASADEVVDAFRAHTIDR